jgi:hypothetical protein
MNAANDGDDGPSAESGSAGDSLPGQSPPATFEFLAHTLFTQALMALGRIPNPITKQAHRNLPTARHFIDTLTMLEQKTAGNLTEDERRMLEEIQHQLRMMYMREQDGAGRPVGAGGQSS